MIKKFFTLFILLALSSVISGLKADEYDDSITFESRTRTFRVYVPSAYESSRSTPLLFVLHGGGGDAVKTEQLTKSGFNTLSETEKFIVVYPNGIENNWNDGRNITIQPAMKENVNDVGFISALIDVMSSKYNIDKKRVYSTGISNGAHMSFRLACELTSRIAAIAPVSGAEITDPTFLYKAAQPIPVLIMNGTDDAFILWGGGYIAPMFYSGELGSTKSINDTVNFWVNANGCNTIPVTTTLPDMDPADGTTVQKSVYGNGKNGSQVVFYTVNGGGHTWPGGDPNAQTALAGKTCKDINACEEIWKFFKGITLIGNNIINSIDNAKGYPNPFNPSAAKDGQFKIINMPVNSIVSIYNINGEIIKVLKETDFGNYGWIAWNGKDESGNTVQRGIYMYVLTDGDCNKKTGKIALVK
ncbi:MAG: hypothetical protein A2231_08565 [Candidatus Firestonebacteria bacterium RIFOXYA2_FULL_40_8]|nr:MAG: hypothetical protein A2231_08565 [Candidatus Firestonebacteria bacterium RIFOXYA2_FULL_40_8]